MENTEETKYYVLDLGGNPGYYRVHNNGLVEYFFIESGDYWSKSYLFDTPDELFSYDPSIKNISKADLPDYIRRKTD